jgi:hypothetical protein
VAGYIRWYTASTPGQERQRLDDRDLSTITDALAVIARVLKVIEELSADDGTHGGGPAAAG